MYPLLRLFFIFTFTVASDIQLICDGILIGHHYYERQMLFGTLDTPSNLVMHKYSGEIFFSRTVREGNLTDIVIRVCNVEKRTCKDLKEVPGGVAIAYDQFNDNVYFGGRNGIYKYHNDTQTAHFYTAQGKNISYMLIHRYLYYIDGITKRLYIYRNGTFSMIYQFENVEMDNFFISRHGSVFFSNKTGLYKCDKINQPFHLVHDNVNVNQIVQHHKAKRVYFAANKGIYYIRDAGTKPASIKKAVAISPVLGMTFRNTTASRFEPIQVLYSDKHSIFKLIPSKQSEMCRIEILRKAKYLREKRAKGRRKKEKRHGAAAAEPKTKAKPNFRELTRI